MARAHFVARKLKRRYGKDTVRAAYELAFRRNAGRRLICRRAR